MAQPLYRYLFPSGLSHFHYKILIPIPNWYHKFFSSKNKCNYGCSDKCGSPIKLPIS